MLDSCEDAHANGGVEALEIRPQLVRRELFLVCDLEVQATGNRVRSCFEMVDLLSSCKSFGSGRNRTVVAHLVEPPKKQPQLLIVHATHQRGGNVLLLLIPSQILNLVITAAELDMPLFRVIVICEGVGKRRHVFSPLRGIGRVGLGDREEVPDSGAGSGVARQHVGVVFLACGSHFWCCVCHVSSQKVESPE